MSRKQTPSDFLKQIIGRPVVVKLNSGVDYRGTFNSWLNFSSFNLINQIRQKLKVAVWHAVCEQMISMHK